MNILTSFETRRITVKQFSISIAIMFLFAFTGIAASSNDYSLVNISGVSVTGLCISSECSSEKNNFSVSCSFGNGEKALLNQQPGSNECTYILSATGFYNRRNSPDYADFCGTKGHILTFNQTITVSNIYVNFQNKSLFPCVCWKLL